MSQSAANVIDLVVKDAKKHLDVTFVNSPFGYLYSLYSYYMLFLF